jgi:hypothetical protein
VKYYELYAAQKNPNALAFWEMLGGNALMVRIRVPLTD